jgi:hypothetical protein
MRGAIAGVSATRSRRTIVAVERSDGGFHAVCLITGRMREDAEEGGDVMAKAERKNLKSPDETRKFEKGTVELVNIGGGTVGRLTLEPGWKWSVHVKPIAKTEWCEAPHFQYHAAGKLHVKMADGHEFDVGPGEITALPQGHDAWVVGDEAVVLIDFAGASNYAK